jgi:alpha-galactosidase
MMTNTYSPYLKEKQSHVYIEYVNSLYKVLERVHRKYPHIPMMLCSGGGGRVDYGALRYFTEFWASDNTDPVERIYVQWGYSYFFPAVAICNHITSWGRQSLKFRTDVAMMGKMGYDIQVNELNEKELAFSQEAIKNYKRLSEVIWRGNQYRLISPYDENRAVVMYVNSNKDKAVLFSYTLNSRFAENFNTIRLQGLDPAKTYEVKEINQFPGIRGLFPLQANTYTGDYLMKSGLNVTTGQPLNSAVLEITEK